jgi:hypothetical protein
MTDKDLVFRNYNEHFEPQPPSHHPPHAPLPSLHPYRPSAIVMAMSLELRRYCIVGSNAVSAFLSWRLQATNACDVTLVWKANFQAVAQYGISFKYVDTVQLWVLYRTQRDLPVSRAGLNGLGMSDSYLVLVDKSPSPFQCSILTSLQSFKILKTQHREKLLSITSSFV